MPQKVSFITTVFHPNRRANAINDHNQQFVNKVQAGGANAWIAVKQGSKTSLNRVEVVIFKIINFIIKLFNGRFAKIDHLFAANREAKAGLYFQKKLCKLKVQDPAKYEAPFVVTGNKIDQSITKVRFHALKAQVAHDRIQEIQAKQGVESNDQFRSLPRKMQKVIENIAKQHAEKGKKFNIKDQKQIADMLKSLYSVRNQQGENVYTQIERILDKKRILYSDLAILMAIETKISGGTPAADFKSEISALDEKHRQLLQSVDLEKVTAQELSVHVKKQISTIKNDEIKEIDLVINDILKKVDHSLAIYEISADRLTSEMTPDSRNDILKKSISVTMVAAEYTGLAKEGGLAEAVQGMAVGIKNQKDCDNKDCDNKVRLIFPKYSKPEITALCVGKSPETFLDRLGNEQKYYTVEIDGIEVYLIEDPSFELKGAKSCIYDEEQDVRFPTFTGLAADLIKHAPPTDVIHLHDWHTAGVALRLKSDNPQEWKDGKVPPIVFTYHNNSRAMQGRLGFGAYCYDPVIQGLIKSGIAVKDTNVFLETLKAADAVTTVSEMFGIESQMIDGDKGGGISFAVREAAASGKLTGITNGSNPNKWNPETNPDLSNWKEIELDASGKYSVSDKPLPLNFKSDSPNILEQKQRAKEQLKLWVEMVKETEKLEENKNPPGKKDEKKINLSGNVDFSKPLVTFIGRFDSYQKGLDKLREAIKETLANGGQFVIMGTDQGDEKANKILDKLQKDYPEGVLIIRDYTDPITGKYHYQNGTATIPAIGPVVRSATEYVFVPSSYEPCGLVQFEAWLFGSLAIGSNTGGLADTIVHPGRNDKSFNGFLFERNGKGEMSLANIIPKALSTWNTFTSTQKREKMREVMDGAKRCGWSESPPEGYSPVEKYRFVYENALKRTPLRNVEASTQFNIDAHFKKVRNQERIPYASSATTNQKKEEEYLRLYSENKLDSEKLDAVYRALPTEVRIMVPSPYGINVNFQTYQEFGAHILEKTTRFKLAAPHAKKVELKIVKGDNAQIHEMKKETDGSFTFECDAPAGTKYQYIVHDGKNQTTIDDPYALSRSPEVDISKAPYSIVTDRNSHAWNDKSWIQERERSVGQSKPMSIYEVHPSLWKKKDGKPLNYRELADELVAHCQKSGFTHIELMDILEHPCNDSWANCYQVNGFFAPNHRMGTPEDFKAMIDTLHNNKIGVFLDFVPAHFAKESFGLMSSQYEDQSALLKNPRAFINHHIRKISFRWGSKFFDFNKKPVREFLLSSAAYWIQEMHIDGLRVDAVRAITMDGLNKEGIHFLKELNGVVHQNYPGVVTMAEDFSEYKKPFFKNQPSTQPYAYNGLGFDYKWHIGWVDKVTAFFQKPLEKRADNYELIVAAASDDQFQNQIMALSHDQTKNGMKSFLEKTPGLSPEEKFANLRTMLTFMMCLPGKKLMMMGTEFGTDQEWGDYFGDKKPTGLADSPDVENENGKKTMACVKAFNELYSANPAMYEKDNPAFKKSKEEIKNAKDNALEAGKEKPKTQNKDLEWLVKDDPHKQVVAYRRASKKSSQSLACLHNFSNQPSSKIEITISKKTAEKIKACAGDVNKIVVALNSDDPKFGGKGEITNDSIELKQNSDGTFTYTVIVPPLSTIVIKECD